MVHFVRAGLDPTVVGCCLPTVPEGQVTSPDEHLQTSVLINSSGTFASANTAERTPA